jgi:hypothetical protein
LRLAGPKHGPLCPNMSKNEVSSRPVSVIVKMFVLVRPSQAVKRPRGESYGDSVASKEMGMPAGTLFLEAVQEGGSRAQGL